MQYSPMSQCLSISARSTRFEGLDMSHVVVVARGNYDMAFEQTLL